MAAKFSRHIAWTSPLAASVENEVAREEHASVSEAVCAALRLLMDRKGESGTASEPTAQQVRRPGT